MTEDELRVKKLVLEIARLENDLSGSSTPQWLRPVYLSILAPILVGMATFLWGVWAGVYDAEQRKSAAEAAIAENEVRQLEERAEMLRIIDYKASREREALARINQDICNAKRGLEEFGPPWDFSRWTLGFFDYLAENNGSNEIIIDALLSGLSEFDSQEPELQQIVVLATETHENIRLRQREISANLQQGKESFASQIEHFEKALDELDVITCAG